MKRRTALQFLASALIPVSSNVGSAQENKNSPQEEESKACLIDTTLCVGCRECEKACNQTNELPPQATSFNQEDVFQSYRRPDAEHFTVVNRFPGQPSEDQSHREETYVKTQCMHCQDPSCVSACIVGALRKTKMGAVIYDEDRCIGCRYCLVACPFQIPAYEYQNPVTPRVRKCDFCYERQTEENKMPACAEICPREAITYGKRSDLLTLAKKRLEENPARYINQVYGESEVGGASWFYLLGRPQEELGLLQLQESAPPRLTESIQHGLFKYGAAPLAFYGVLGGIMWVSKRQNQNPSSEEDPNE